MAQLPVEHIRQRRRAAVNLHRASYVWKGVKWFILPGLFLLIHILTSLFLAFPMQFRACEQELTFYGKYAGWPANSEAHMSEHLPAQGLLCCNGSRAVSPPSWWFFLTHQGALYPCLLPACRACSLSSSHSGLSFTILQQTGPRQGRPVFQWEGEQVFSYLSPLLPISEPANSPAPLQGGGSFGLPEAFQISIGGSVVVDPFQEHSHSSGTSLYRL